MNDLDKIIKQSQKGNVASQRKLYELHQSRWFMVSLRYGKNKMQAEDILQEGLINIYNNLSSYDSSKAAFSTWSTRVLINSALNYLKKNIWADKMSDIDEVYDITDNSETVYDKLSAKELTQLVQQLPTGYRVVFNLYVIEGYNHREIGEQLGISEGTSKSQLSKARKELRNKLESQLNSNLYE